jgi:hypothetical protein
VLPLHGSLSDSCAVTSTYREPTGKVRPKKSPTLFALASLWMMRLRTAFASDGLRYAGNRTSGHVDLTDFDVRLEDFVDALVRIELRKCRHGGGQHESKRSGADYHRFR